MSGRVLRAGALAAGLLLAACTAPGDDAPEPAPAAPVDVKKGPAVVVGSVIEAASGRPVEGAVVTGPGGAEAVTDAEGRFRLKGLAIGAAGPVSASAGAMEGSIRLRPLLGGRLEVVLYLR